MVIAFDSITTTDG